MICPFCQTVNRDDQETCYYCNKDLSMLRLIINKSKHHYNLALEHAERGRYKEAIAELNISLDLDKSNINARVVLGTIYARLQQFDKATEQWEKALSEDQRLLKTHNYLNRANQLKKSRVLLKWINILVASLLVLLLLTIYVTVKAYTPNKDYLLLTRAWNYFKENNYSQSLKNIEQLKGNEKELSGQLRLMLSSIIKKELSHTQELVKSLIGQGEYQRALQQIEVLLSKTPPDEVVADLNSSREDIKKVLLKEMDDLLTSYEQGELSFDEVKRRAQEFSGYFPESKAFNSQLMNKLNQVKYASFEAAFTSLQQQREEGQDPAIILASAEEMLQKFTFPMQQEKISQLIAELKKEVVKQLLASAQNAIEKRDVNQARTLVNKAQKLISPSDLSASLNDELQKLSKQITNIKKEELLKQFEVAYANSRFQDVVNLATEAKKYNLNVQELGRIEKKLNVARLKLALEYYNWMEARDGQFEEGRINEEEATTTIRHYQFVLDYLPRKGYGGVFHQVLFYAGSAYLKLGEIGKAKKVFSTLEVKYPWSPYILKAKALLENY